MRTVRPSVLEVGVLNVARRVMSTGWIGWTTHPAGVPSLGGWFFPRFFLPALASGFYTVYTYDGRIYVWFRSIDENISNKGTNELVSL